MTRRRFALGLACLLCIMLVFAGIGLVRPALAQGDPTATPAGSYVIRDNIFVRAGPGEFFTAVGSLMRGAVVVPLGRNLASNWIVLRYNQGFGWIRRDLASWAVNVDDLPVIDETTLTVTPLLVTYVLPTETPRGNWVNADAAGAFVRVGPGITYDALTLLQSGVVVEPVGRTSELDWILIRIDDGFGWIARTLVRWTIPLESLPILQRGNLTPTASFTSTVTPSTTPTATATATTTPSATATATPLPSATVTATPSATATATPTPSETATATTTPTASLTASPSLTFTLTPSETSAPPLPSLTPSTTPVDTPTATQIPTATASPSPTAPPPPTALPTNTLPPTESPTVTPSLTLTASITPEPATSAPLVLPSTTPSPTQTPTSTHTATVTPVPTATLTLMPAIVVIVPTLPESSTEAQPPTATEPPSPTALPAITEVTDSSPNGLLINPELLAGIVGLVAVGVYGAFYWRGLLAMDRYRDGFVITHCPICQQGDLVVETRRERFLGIPRPRRIVHCDHCRSLLREAGHRRWRYAVDPLDNPAMYHRLNGQVLDEETLFLLSSQPIDVTPVARTPQQPPRFVDDEEQG